MGFSYLSGSEKARKKFRKNIFGTGEMWKLWTKKILFPKYGYQTNNKLLNFLLSNILHEVEFSN